jgi:hypothetical protein
MFLDRRSNPPSPAPIIDWGNAQSRRNTASAIMVVQVRLDLPMAVS